MKVIMYEWYKGIKNLPSWFKDDQEIEIDFDKIKELFDTGNNVMISHIKGHMPGEVVAVLWVDDKQFTQR